MRESPKKMTMMQPFAVMFLVVGLAVYRSSAPPEFHGVVYAGLVGAISAMLGGAIGQLIDKSLK